MSELLLLKTLGDEYIIKSVKAIEKYLETHVVRLQVLISDNSVSVYDNNTLLLNIRIGGLN